MLKMVVAMGDKAVRNTGVSDIPQDPRNAKGPMQIGGQHVEPVRGSGDVSRAETGMSRGVGKVQQLLDKLRCPITRVSAGARWRSPCQSQA